MKRLLLTCAFFTLLIFALAGGAQAWQGRMNGMGDPYGLVADESDFLIHPAKIVQEEATRFYWHHSFNYTDENDWDLDWPGWWSFDFAGDIQKSDILTGTVFPLGSGRTGIFLSYDGQRGDYDGDGHSNTSANTETDKLQKDFDEFNLRFLYGLPLCGLNLGTEIRIAYRDEKDEIYESANNPSRTWLNDDFLLDYLFPFNSQYWEALFKGSVAGKLGAFDMDFTLRSGYIFASENQWNYKYWKPVGVLDSGADMSGDVDGWRIGGDLWARRSLSDGLTLPLLVGIDYRTKDRDGAGTGYGNLAGNTSSYEQETRNVVLTTGGGVDKAYDKDTRIAAGIYYSYIKGTNEYLFPGYPGYRYTVPEEKEHRGILRITGETRFTPAVVLRGDLSGFYGRMKFEEIYQGPNFDNHYSTDGPHWGVSASMGGTITLKRFILEPFIRGGYDKYNLEDYFDLTRKQWFIGGGMSIMFDL